jgi:hypothetical protein
MGAGLMFSIQERYSQAIRSANLTCDANTTFSDLDVIGAMAIADRRLSQGRMPRIGSGVISRLLAGDQSSLRDAVLLLSGRVILRADEDGIFLSSLQAADIAKSCIAWLVLGRCGVCGGHGKEWARGAPIASDEPCAACAGSGKPPFIGSFAVAHRDIAKWTVQEMARDLGLCGAEALRALAPREGER